MFTSILERIYNWFLSTKIWKKIGYFCANTSIRPFGYTTFPIDDYFKIIDTIEPNNYYAFMSNDTRTFSSFIIEGLIGTTGAKALFTHAGMIFFDGDRNTKIMHIDQDGFEYQSLLTLLKKVDYFGVVKILIKKDSEKTINERIENIKQRAPEIEYDWQEILDNSPNKLYCSEMVYTIFKDMTLNPLKPILLAGDQVFDPDSILTMGELIYSNHPNLPKY